MLSGEVDQEIEDMRKRGVIEPSESLVAASVVLDRKKDGTQRLSVDCRILNTVTVNDTYPHP